MRIGLPRQFEWLKWVIVLIFIINAIDGLLTVVWVLSGQAEEANPLMADLLARSPAAFIIIKLVLVAMGSYLLWRYRRQRAAVIGLFLLFIAYYVLLVYHFSAIATVVFPL